MWLTLDILECLREDRLQYVDLAVNMCFSFPPVVFIQSNYMDYELHCTENLQLTGWLSQWAIWFSCHSYFESGLGTFSYSPWKCSPTKHQQGISRWWITILKDKWRGTFLPPTLPQQGPLHLVKQVLSRRLLHTDTPPQYPFSLPFPYKIVSLPCFAKETSSGPECAFSAQRSKHPVNQAPWRRVWGSWLLSLLVESLTSHLSKRPFLPHRVLLLKEVLRDTAFSRSLQSQHDDQKIWGMKERCCFVEGYWKNAGVLWF